MELALGWERQPPTRFSERPQGFCILGTMQGTGAWAAYHEGQQTCGHRHMCLLIPALC